MVNDTLLYSYSVGLTHYRSFRNFFEGCRFYEISEGFSPNECHETVFARKIICFVGDSRILLQKLVVGSIHHSPRAASESGQWRRGATPQDQNLQFQEEEGSCTSHLWEGRQRVSTSAFMREITAHAGHKNRGPRSAEPKHVYVSTQANCCSTFRLFQLCLLNSLIKIHIFQVGRFYGLMITTVVG